VALHSNPCPTPLLACDWSARRRDSQSSRASVSGKALSPLLPIRESFAANDESCFANKRPSVFRYWSHVTLALHRGHSVASSSSLSSSSSSYGAGRFPQATTAVLLAAAMIYFEAGGASQIGDLVD